VAILWVPAGYKTRQNPGLRSILVFFSDLGVELLILKISILILFEFCFCNLRRKFKVNVFICVELKLDKIWAQCIVSKTILFSKKKTFFDQNVFFERKENSKKNAFFRKNCFFRFNALGPKRSNLPE
jgi:hypothetical protein